MPTEEKQLDRLTGTQINDPEITSAALEAAALIKGSTSPQPAPMTEHTPDESADLAQDELEARDRHILAALDAMLERRSPKATAGKPSADAQNENAIEKFMIGFVRKGAGIISLSLVLILMGISVLYCLLSESADVLLPLKLSPVAAVLLGLELLIYHLCSGKRFRVHFPAIIIMAVLVAGCCTLAIVLNGKLPEAKRAYDESAIASQIYESGYHELRHAADIKDILVSVELNDSSRAHDEGMKSLGSADKVILTVTFSGAYKSSQDFAGECKTVIDAYKLLNIPISRFHFISDNKFTCCRLDVEGKYMQDMTESELTAAVNCVFVDDYGYIKDLDDISEETEEAGTNELL
ncbi:MAG: hypothetical protein ACI4KA_08510 [Oscillospiraceae bacterium]